MIIDSATGGAYDVLGHYIELAGQEDSSGLRRALHDALVGYNYEWVGRVLKIDSFEVAVLRKKVLG